MKKKAFFRTVRDLSVEGLPVALLLPLEVEERLGSTCFRGRFQRLAGNFCWWSNFGQFFAAMEVRMAKALQTLIKEFLVKDTDKTRFQTNFEFESNEVIGWSSTDDLVKYMLDELEPFELNAKAHGLRVKSPERLAPLTRRITMNCEFRREHDRWLVKVWTLYPGCDVGELKGNVTARKQQVFFTWERAGEPLPR